VFIVKLVLSYNRIEYCGPFKGRKNAAKALVARGFTDHKKKKDLLRSTRFTRIGLGGGIETADIEPTRKRIPLGPCPPFV
jgi:hypothetical protein